MAKFPPRKRELQLQRETAKGLRNAHRRLRARRIKYSAHQFIERHPKGKHPTVAGLKVSVISCAVDMDLEANNVTTLEVINDIRRWSGSVKSAPFYVDFKPIRTITPAAALLLAAELDRWNSLHYPKKLQAVDVDQWDPFVRQLLQEMGFFTLLKIPDVARQNIEKGNDSTSNVNRFLPFQTGSGSDGAAAAKLKDQIETFAGHLKDRYSLYDGLVEAMTNVVHHAYPVRDRLSKWWISACIDRDNQRLTVLCLDHGVGIPDTLPRKNLESIRGIMKTLGASFLKDDARMIQAAVDLERSSTGQAYRGHGLKRDILSLPLNFGYRSRCG